MSSAILVGNPKARSRTYEAAQFVVERLTGRPPGLSVDLVDLGASLLDWSDPTVEETIAALATSELLVVASPTYKATFTGVLKVFLDRVAAGALGGVVAVPLMVGGHWRHALAPEVFLKPVLVELGATCPTAGLFLLESELGASSTLEAWLEVAATQLAPVLGAPRG